MNILERFDLWIRNISFSTQVSDLVNGSPVCYFSCSRGSGKGIFFLEGFQTWGFAISLLFCIAEDFFSRAPSWVVNNSEFSPMFVNWSGSAPTNLLYADDILLFC